MLKKERRNKERKRIDTPWTPQRIAQNEGQQEFHGHQDRLGHTLRTALGMRMWRRKNSKNSNNLCAENRNSNSNGTHSGPSKGGGSTNNERKKGRYTTGKIHSTGITTKTTIGPYGNRDRRTKMKSGSGLYRSGERKGREQPQPQRQTKPDDGRSGFQPGNNGRRGSPRE